MVSLIQAKEYLNAVAKYGNYIAIGVMLCIFSPICLIFLGGLTEISDLQNNVAFNENVAGFLGLLILFILIIIAVAIFVYTGNQLEEYEYLKKNIFQLDTATETYIREERKNNRKRYSYKMIIGISLCIFGVIPLLCAAFFFDDFVCILAVCFLLVAIGIGVKFLVEVGMEDDSYKILLQEGDYNKDAKNKRMEAISSIYWCTVTAIYLAWSFYTCSWGTTWIIWPVAGVLYGVITAIVDFVDLIKK